MNRFFYVLLGASIIFGTSIAVSKANKSAIFYRGTFLNSDEIKDKWGNEKLDLGLWNKGVVRQRSKMAYNIIVNKKTYIGKTNLDIKKIFGSWDSYYVNDTVPSYTVQENSGQKHERWELVFMIDQNSKVFDIKVHRNYP